MRQAQTLIMVVVFIVFAALIGLTLAMMVGGSLMMPKYSYNTELAFYAADAGLARALKIISDYPDWDTSGCCVSSGPECLSFQPCNSDGDNKCYCKNKNNGKCYFREMYYINAASSKKVYYMIYRKKDEGPQIEGRICDCRHPENDPCKPLCAKPCK